MTTRGDPTVPPRDPWGFTLPRLRITRDGEWLHDGVEITHPGILANVRDNLRVDAAGHYLQVGPVRVPVEVDDAPWVVLRVEVEGEQLVLTLNDLSREPLAVDTLAFGADDVPRCRVKTGRFAERLSRAATYQLLEHVEQEGGEGRRTLVVGGRRHAV